MKRKMMQYFCISLSDLLYDSTRLAEAKVEIERLRGTLRMVEVSGRPHLDTIKEN